MGIKKAIMGKNDISVPLCLSGSITSLPIFSHCMDGATHEIHSFTQEPTRLKGRNEGIQKELDDFTDAKVIVTICGNLARGPECPYIDVYYVGIAANFENKLKQSIA